MISRDETDNIDYNDLHKLKEKYWNLLDQFPFPHPPAKATAIGMLFYFKRRDEGCGQIGCYKNISVFEAANRIATDLVIIKGIIQLVELDESLRNEKFILRLGTRHEKGKGDFSIGEKEGEAFNVAPSFLKVKLRGTLKKWEASDLSYILINAEVAEKLVINRNKPQIIKVSNWDSR